MDIRLVEREDIEEAKWNGCVHYANNSKIYGYTWYLDNVAEHWCGLVEGDYQSVFPLVWNQKIFGIKQLYQPLLCQQLGLFSVHVRSKKRIEAFLEAIPSDFKYIDIHLNDRNYNIKKIEELDLVEKPNYVLNLNKPYEILSKSYSSNVKRNIKKAEKSNLFLSTNITPEKLVAEVKKSQEAKGNNMPDQLFHTAHRIIYNCLHRGLGGMHVVTDKDDDSILHAAIFFMYSGGNVMINLLNVTTEAGRKSGAMHYLLDYIIKINANKRKLIDFEGSSIAGIARFYESFGAENVPYYHLKQNRLPWWIRWKKK
ncbi:MAG: hypothetical protein GY810_08710 [Aureispira sp.]|nr:hypothetical protein [Aureispira sp.]